MRFYNSILIALAAVLAGCSPGPVKISLTNDSRVTVSNVYVSGEHFGVPLGSMTPGMSVSFPLKSRSENGVWVTFESDGHSIDSRGNGRPSFFEVSPQNPLSLKIGTDLQVVSSSDTKSH